MALELTSDAFNDGADIPAVHTCDGRDVSPPLSIRGVPDGAESLVLIADDPDAPRGTWVHWVLYGLPPDVGELPRGVAGRGGALEGSRQGENDFGDLGYGGPCPPAGEEHRYFFRLYALDADPDLEAGLSKDEVLEVVEPMVLESWELMGRYRRA